MTCRARRLASRSISPPAGANWVRDRFLEDDRPTWIAWPPQGDPPPYMAGMIDRLTSPESEAQRRADRFDRLAPIVTLAFFAALAIAGLIFAAVQSP